MKFNQHKLSQLITNIITLIQLVTMLLLPSLIFNQIKIYHGSFISFYLQNVNLGIYIFGLGLFSMLGFIVNVLNYFKVFKSKLFFLGLCFFSAIPNLIIFLLCVFNYFGFEDKSKIFINNDRNILTEISSSLICIKIFNVVALIGSSFVLLMAFIIPGEYFNGALSKPALIAMLVFGCIAIFNLLLILIFQYGKNNIFGTIISLINIFTAFFPLLLGCIFAIRLFFKIQQHIFVNKKSQQEAENIIMSINDC